MSYEESMQFYQEIEKQRIKPNLKNVYNILEELNNPHHRYKVIHITGTNGKGSTSMFIYNILKENGVRVGLFSSPYVEKVNDMISVCGQLITDDEFAKLTEEIQQACEKLKQKELSVPTPFECYTALAFLFFFKKKIQVAIIEVGMGGRDDATNVFDFPHICVFTSISIDHQKELGNTLVDITTNKSGIIKKNCIAFLSNNPLEVEQVIRKRVMETDSQLFLVPKDSSIEERCVDNKTFYSIENQFLRLEKIQMKMEGQHQLQNLSTVLSVIGYIKEKYPIETSKLIKAIYSTQLPCRLEVVNKPYPILFDAAHNVDSLKQLLEFTKNRFQDYEKKLLFGCLADKEINDLMKLLSTQFHCITLVEADSPRKLSLNEMKQVAARYFHQVEVTKKPYKWLKTHWNNQRAKELIVCTGSFYVAYPLRQKFLVE